uniref:Uncharacterized protein n=1 Tax=Arcella intermedia TaxID=1963864 RepID=A0A6B2LQP1_9EUKA
MRLSIWEKPVPVRYIVDSRFFKGLGAAMVVYDVTDVESFQRVQWVLERGRDVRGVLKMIVGNKCDLESRRKVSAKDGQDLADLWQVEFMEASAKDGSNVQEAFMRLISAYIKNKQSQHN